MLFEAGTYSEQRYHEQVRDQNVEDMAIIRQIKQQRLKGHTMLSSGEVECRMHRGYGEAIGGMTRSVFAFFGGSGVVMVVEAFRRRFRERNSWRGREIKFE